MACGEPGPLGGFREPGALLHRVLDPQRRLHVDGLRHVGVTGLGNEVLGQVVLALQAVELLAKLGVQEVGLQPGIGEVGVVEVPKSVRACPRMRVCPWPLLMSVVAEYGWIVRSRSEQRQGAVPGSIIPASTAQDRNRTMTQTAPTPRRALITGGASGFGLGVARALLDQGASVAIGDLHAGRLREAAQALAADKRLLALDLDVTAPASVAGGGDRLRDGVRRAGYAGQ